MSERFEENTPDLAGDDEHDIVEFSDDEGNTLLLEVMDYFFYNGDEYAVLMNADEAAQHEHGPDCHHGHADDDDEHEEDMYIMRVINSVNEDGEEMEEFLPVEDDLLDQLVEVVQARFAENDDDDNDDDDEDEDEYEDWDEEEDEEEEDDE